MTQQHNFGTFFIEKKNTYSYEDELCETYWAVIRTIIKKPDDSLFEIEQNRIIRYNNRYEWYWKENELNMDGRYQIQCIGSFGPVVKHGNIYDLIVRENLV